MSWGSQSGIGLAECGSPSTEPLRSLSNGLDGSSGSLGCSRVSARILCSRAADWAAACQCRGEEMTHIQTLPARMRPAGGCMGIAWPGMG